MRWFTIALVLLLAVCMAWAADKPSQTLTFKVNGRAEGFPETALLRFSVVAEGESLAKAQEELQRNEADIMELLRGFHIQYDLTQVERFKVDPLESTESSRSNLRTCALGFRIQRDYAIPIQAGANKLDKLVEIADAVFQKGGKLSPAITSSPSSYSQSKATVLEFAVTNRDKLLQDALDDGIARARKLAEQAVKQIEGVKVKLTRVNVTEPQRGYDIGLGYHTNLPTSTIWLPVEVNVTVEATFSYE